jgi:hypothetical protein
MVVGCARTAPAGQQVCASNSFNDPFQSFQPNFPLSNLNFTDVGLAEFGVRR